MCIKKRISSQSLSMTIPHYKKSEAIKIIGKHFLEFDRAKQPLTPQNITSTSLRDDADKKLIKDIMIFLKKLGHKVSKVPASDRRKDNLKTYTEVIGKSLKNGSKKRKSEHKTHFNADILTTIGEWPLEIKVDMGIDSKLSPGKDYKIPFSDEGIPCVVVSSLKQFLRWYKLIFVEGKL